jgi:hypothetical protein
VHEFKRATYDFFMQNEEQNVIPLGNILLGVAGEDKSEWRDPANWLMATVVDDELQIAAIMTPPREITLYAKKPLNENAMNCLIDRLKNHEISGVITEKNLALFFAEKFCAAKNLSHETEMNQRIFQLTHVNEKIPCVGKLRLAEEKDMYFFPFWAEAFYAAHTFGNLKMNEPHNFENYKNRIASKNVFILEENSTPVSMAQISRGIKTVCGVGFVYTPPYFRGRGYASSCVAQVSQIILDRGFEKCILYTDLANPTSNNIYKKIGYSPICDSLMLKFI